MPQPIDITGKVFGKLTAVRRASTKGANGVLWHCRCECGETIEAYAGYLRNGSPRSCVYCRSRDSIENTFDDHWKEKPETGCWEWQRTKDKHGYGGLRANNRWVKAYRFSYERSIGPIPKGMSVLHSCDNPPCVNPDHLFLGTQADNLRDMRRKGRHVSGFSKCIGTRNRSSKLTEEDVREIRRLYRENGMTQRQLATQFGVTKTPITLILNGSTWKHVT